MTAITLTMPSFQLADWSDEDFMPWSRAVDDLEKLVLKAGKTSLRYQQVTAMLRTYTRLQNQAALLAAMSTPLALRAWAHLLASDDAFAQNSRLTPALLSRFDGSIYWGRQTLYALIHAYFKRFDLLLPHNALPALGEVIDKRLISFASNRRQSKIERLHRYRRYLFSFNAQAEAPDWVVRQAGQQSDALEHFFLELGIDQTQGRFLDLCRYRYYIRQLETIPVGADTPLFKTLLQRSIYETPYNQKGWLMGHEILKVLIDRAPEDHLSKVWQGVILSIAGDPRGARLAGFQRWWARLGELRVRKMAGWLAKLDLKLFLHALKRFAEEQSLVGQDDVLRMYRGRMSFLNGLMKQKLVHHARLFVNPKMGTFLQQNYTQNELPSYASITGNSSVIYLKVGHCHLIEGSHSFKLWFFSELPKDLLLFNYDAEQRFNIDALRGELQREEVQSKKGVGIRHTPWKLSWQYQAISYLKKEGIRLDISEMFNRDDYLLYKKIYGL
ncbi:EH signature domain-containing protein [Magnetococcales bacterium HHB-1]